MILHLDIESRSDLDLRKVGLHVYAKGKNTDIICACYAFDDGPVNLWLPGTELDPDIIEHIESGGSVWAHNSSFEEQMLNSIGVRKYGWPYLYTEQMVCTMAMSYSMGLPGTLEKTAAALGIPEQKDMAGSRLMLQMCAPREIRVDGSIVWWDEPDKMKRLWEYCRQDVIVERAIGKRMLRLSNYEKKVWLLDQKINARGIAIDRKAASHGVKLVEEEKKRLNLEVQELSHNQIATCTAVQQIKDYLTIRGVPNVEGLAKNDVVDLLALDTLPDDCRKILQLRQEAGKASTSKLEAMLLGSDKDARLRGCFQYSGANTRRWAGRRVQLHNLKRPELKPELVDSVLKSLSDGASAEVIDAFYGPPLSVLADCIRGFIVAAPKHDLLACDFSAIEARVIAWLAGQESVLELFRKNEDVYIHAAAKIFSKKPHDVDKTERQIGKVAILALGYQGGVGALQTMAKAYGVRLAPAYKALWRVASESQREWAERVFNQSGEKAGISREEYIACDLTKTFWREANTKIVSYWSDLEQAAVNAVLSPRVTFSVGPQSRQVSFLLNGSFLWCKLPSGGVICYPYPEVQTITTPWGQEKQGLTYMTEDGPAKKWSRIKTYSGSLAENVTQSFARDLLADAMLRLEGSGYPIVATVHDEIVCELPEGKGSVDEMAKIMTEVPTWAKDLPIAAGGWRGKRYRK